MKKAIQYGADPEEEEEKDTLSALRSDQINIGLTGVGAKKGKVRMSLTASAIPMRNNKGRTSILTTKSNKVRQSVALFSRSSFMIKPAAPIQKQTNNRLSMLRGMPEISEIMEEDVEDMDDKGFKRQQTTRTSIFNRMNTAKRDLHNMHPVIACLGEYAFAYYDYWEYYTTMIFIYLLAMFMVFNPFSKEICGDWPCFPGAALDVEPLRAVFLLIAKWTAAALYVLFAELVFIYSRVYLGHLQMTALHMYVPYLVSGYHDAHKKRGWWFVVCAVVHTVAHFLRVAMDATMPEQLWISGGFLLFSVLCIAVLASRNFTLCCFTGRWARAFLRGHMKWELMRGIHLMGVVGMLVAAYWHKFPEGESPLEVTFNYRFFILFLAITCFYLSNRVLLWYYTEQIDIITHTVYKSCQLVVIQDFPFAKDFCNHGRSWFSADAKVMFPDINSREWHPFTCVVNSATGQGYMLIKNYGDWSECFTQVPASFLYMRTPPIRMSVEIPPQYSRVLVVASGTFITTVAGTVARAIALGDEEDVSTQDIVILWIDREPVMIALVCLRLLSEFTNTNFKIYCTAKQTKVTDHLDEIQIMSTKAANVELDHSDKNGNIEENVHDKMAKATMEHDESDGAATDVQTFLENVVEEFPHIEINSGRPPMEEIFDELRPNFVFCGAAPPVARQVLGLAEKFEIDYRTSSYL